MQIRDLGVLLGAFANLESQPQPPVSAFPRHCYLPRFSIQIALRNIMGWRRFWCFGAGSAGEGSTRSVRLPSFHPHCRGTTFRFIAVLTDDSLFYLVIPSTKPIQSPLPARGADRERRCRNEQCWPSRHAGCATSIRTSPVVEHWIETQSCTGHNFEGLGACYWHATATRATADGHEKSVGR